MTLTPGTRLGPYEVTALLGVGGMGEVYQARDSRLQRDVAVKILRDEIFFDGRRRARFEREARTLAALSHPGIAAIYAYEEIDGRAVLAMELVGGEPLDKRIARGLAVDEALAIARQIAEALEAAHEKGIIHRDLKPANVHVSAGGKVTLLDFGIAKALEAEVTVSQADITRTPTLTSAGTAAGMIVGTPAYMSPEQARGKPLDKRADIWAFGAVLYEMLSGRRAFAGETPSDVLVALLTRDSDWTALPAATPPAVTRLLRRCLARDPASRLHDIADARIELTEPSPASLETTATPAGSPERTTRRAIFAAVAAVLLAAAAAAGIFLAKAIARTEPPLFRTLTWSFGSVFSGRFTPDGQNVVYSAELEGRPPALFTSRVDAVDSRVLDLPMGDVMGISRTGEMALILGRHNVGSWLRIGTLAKASVSGGSPRPVLEDVFDADIAPDGNSFAVVLADRAGQRLEYPIGHVVYRNTGWIAHPRISKDGRRVAFADYATDGDDEGTVNVIDADGKITRLSKTLDYLQGLAWSPSGEEIWATGYELEKGTTLWAFSPSKPPRALLRAPSVIHIVDVAGDGSVLMSYDETHVELEGRLAGDERPRTYSWWRANVVAGISNDGAVFAGDGAVSVAEGGMIVFYRRANGSPPVRIGLGKSAGISPDGRAVFVRTGPHQFQAIPTGTGQPRTYELGNVEPHVSGIRHLSFSSDGKRAAFAGVAPGSDRRGYVLDLSDGGPPRPITPPGVDDVLMSPDGASIAATAEGQVRIYPLDGGAPRVVPATRPGEIPVAWESSGRALFVWDRGIPARVYRLDLASGERTLGLEIAPRNPAGVLYGFLRVTPDLGHYLFRFRRRTSYLCTATGVR